MNQLLLLRHFATEGNALFQTLLCFFIVIVASDSSGNDPDLEAQTPVAAKPTETQPAGHSYHGEYLNDGPRQAAYLMRGTGEIYFPVTTANDQTRAFVEQGIGQLHGFWFLEAERSFRHAAALDPDCAMAYWGAALATKKVEKRAKGFIAEAVARKDSCTKREQMYIDALDAYLNFQVEKDVDKSESHEDAKSSEGKKEKRAAAYTDALEAIALEFPEDVEAKAFLALQLYDNKGVLKNPSFLAVDGLLDKIFASQPMHPAHHYRIHWWDYKRPELALQSAALCGPAAPAIAHMWHMPGHIYSRLKRYPDAIWQQEASARVDHAHMMRDRLLPDQIHNFAHNNEWLIRNFNHVGSVSMAIDLAKNMIELPQHPRYNTLDKRGSAKFGRQRLMETLERFEMWQQAYQLCQSPYLEATGKEREQWKRLRLLGAASFMSDRVQAGDEVLSELRSQIECLQQQQQAAAEEAEQRASEKDVDKARRAVDDRIKELQQSVAYVSAFKAVAEQDFDRAADLAGDSGSLLSPLWKARVDLRCGQPHKAIKEVEKEVKKAKNEILPLACLVELLFAAGELERCRKVFTELQAVSPFFDEVSPLAHRISEIAQQLDVKDPWRGEWVISDDIGERPALDELGPFRWSPNAAACWKLIDSEDRVHTLDDYAGQPLVLIFYLGAGCLHCTEQLQAFAPLFDKFEAEGIKVLAISTETDSELRLAVDRYDEPFPFPLLSNGDLSVFRDYRCYDDFESQPLHGTFLIDGKGDVRWQDIGYEPFMKPNFLLQESLRLLSFPGTCVPTGP